jgi:FkbM family methyltransferase
MSNDLFRDQLNIVGSDANVIFDVGSHTGESTLEYLVNFPRARVFAFEPDMTNFAAASDAIAIHRQRCSLHAIALADSNGRAKFHVNSHNGTHSLLAIGAQEFWAGPAHEVQKVSVETRTMDSFVAEQAVSTIDILKMDIQGGELLALKGAQSLLEASRIRLLALEVEFKPLYKDQPLFWDICAFLYRFGYSFFKLYDPMYHPRNKNVLCWGDAVFLAPELTRLGS